MVTQRIQAREVGHRFQAKGLYPKSRGTFIRRRADVVELERGATGGTWGLLPWFAKTPEIEFNTVNARRAGGHCRFLQGALGPWPTLHRPDGCLR